MSRTHNWSVEEYREAFHLNRATATCSRELSQERRRHTRQLLVPRAWASQPRVIATMNVAGNTHMTTQIAAPKRNLREAFNQGMSGLPALIGGAERNPPKISST